MVAANQTLYRGKKRAGCLKVMSDYPDRIVLAGDQFFSHPKAPSVGPLFSFKADKVRNNFRKLLDSLPPDLAHKIGFENTIRIYKLNWQQETTRRHRV